MTEWEALKLFRINIVLRKYQLQLVAPSQYKLSARLWTYADPIKSLRRKPCAIRLDGNLEFEFVQCANQSVVELEEGFTTGAHNKWTGSI